MILCYDEYFDNNSNLVVKEKCIKSIHSYIHIYMGGLSLDFPHALPSLIQLNTSNGKMIHCIHKHVLPTFILWYQ